MSRFPALAGLALALALAAGCGDLRYIAGIPKPTVTLGAPAPIELPFREGPGGLVLLTGRVNDAQDVEFILDTGAPVTVLIDGPRTSRLGLDTTGARRLGPEGDPASPVGVIRPGLRVAFGPVVLSDLHAVLIPASTMPCPERFEAVGFGGVVGADLFRRFVVEIDRGSKRVRLHEPTAWTPPAGASPVPVTLDGGGHWYVDASIESGGAAPVPVRVHLDTGMSRALTLVAGAHPSFVMPASGADRGGCYVSGRSIARDGAPVAVTLGATRLEAVTPTIAEAKGQAGTHKVGAIGAALLARKRVVLDLPARRLFLLD